MKLGQKIKFIGCSPEQVKWGGNDDPRGKLVKGRVYTIAKIEIHSWYTELCLEEVEGRYNSVCFSEINEIKGEGE